MFVVMLGAVRNALKASHLDLCKATKRVCNAKLKLKSTVTVYSFSSFGGSVKQGLGIGCQLFLNCGTLGFFSLFIKGQMAR